MCGCGENHVCKYGSKEVVFFPVSDGRHTMVAPPFLVSPLVDLTSSILSATDPLVHVAPPAGGCDFVRNLRRPIAEYCGPYRKQGARDMHHTKTAKGPTCKHIMTYTQRDR